MVKRLKISIGKDGSQMVPSDKKNGSQLGGGLPPLTKAEADVYPLFAEEFLTPQQVALRRHTSFRAAYKIYRSIKLKGYFADSVHRPSKRGVGCEPKWESDTFSEPSFPVEMRLHAQAFRIAILSKTLAYEKLRKRNVQYMDGHTVMLERNVVVVHAGPDAVFRGRNEDDALAVSLDYWQGFFGKLEGRLGIGLLKDRKQNIVMFRGHYARENDPGAVDAARNDRKVQVWAHDGRLAFQHDLSRGPAEAETMHPEEAHDDMTTYREFVEDLLEKRPMRLSEMQGLLGEMGRLHAQTNDQLKTLVMSQQATAQQVQILVSTLQALLPKPEREGRKSRIQERPPYVG